MRIAYMIAAHTDPIQLRRLVFSLNGEDIEFFIHIDKKNDIQPFFRELNIENVHFLENRISTNWGAFSQCEYQKALIKAVLNFEKKFDRVFFLSGLDYPLWSNQRISSYLSEISDKEFIMGMNLTDCFNPPKMQTRVCQYHFRDLSFGNAFLRRLIYGIVRETLDLLQIRKKNYICIGKEKHKVYCGSSWWCLTGDCLQYVYDTICTAKEYQRYFKTCLAPDEMLVQTIVFNSKYAKKAILHEGEYPGLVGLTPLHYIEYNGQIRVYDEDDFEMLINSGKMFVRKVKSGISDKLISKIDQYRQHEEIDK